MNEQDYFSGGVYPGSSGVAADGTSLPRTNSFLLIPSKILNPTSDPPAQYDAPGPVIITSYKISQGPSGTGIVLVFFDDITLPEDGSAWGQGGQPVPLWAAVIPAGAGTFIHNPAGPGDHYYKGFGVVASTSWTNIVYGNEDLLFEVNYAPVTVG